MIHAFYYASIQELPKYLRGYHNCTKEDMINLGGLLFRVEVDSDRSQFVMIPKMLRELIPADEIKIMSPDEWKKVRKKCTEAGWELMPVYLCGGGARRHVAFT